MKTKQWKKWLSGMTAAALLLGVVPGPAPASAAPELPKLLITELVPDTTNLPGISKDGYEFIEIYNNSDSLVDLRDYSLVYGATPWPLTAPDQATTIPAYGTIVLWVMNDSNKEVPAATFNNNYGVQLTEGVSLFRVNGGGGLINSG
ncbi:MAG: metallophosphoesterase, partial [Paenibacillus sp.]|nr:metallophosphoesterase [Paenibacillus sp.]